MILISYNIRQGGILSKGKRISFLLNSNKVDVCFIQETKWSSFNENIANSFWGGVEVDWSTSNSEGASGGMVIIWRKGFLNVNYSCRGQGYNDINITRDGSSVNLINLYVPCSVITRRGLWDSLGERRSRYGNKEWCISGYFNEITSWQERIGEGDFHNRRGMEDFKEFIERTRVIDIPCVGGKFSWFKDNGKAMSRIDHFLISNNLIEGLGVNYQRIGVRYLSDHAPIRLNCGRVDWGPKSFRFNNTWLKHVDFKDFITNE